MTTLTIVETQPAPPPLGELRALVEMYYDSQKFRVRGSNRMKALQRGDSDAEGLAIHVDRLRDMEKELAKQIGGAVKDEPAYPWLIAQRGVGPVMAGALIASGLDPEIDKPSAWWRFAGVGVVNGKNQRKRRGEKLSYNGFLRRTLEVLCSQFLKAHQPPDKPSFYGDLYYKFRDESIRGRPEIGSGTGKDIHHHRRAIMKTQRVFLTHLQLRWREALGMTPPRVPYIHALEGGVHELIPPP